MNPEIAAETTRRIQMEMGAMRMEMIRMQVEAEAKDRALAEAQKPKGPPVNE